MKIAFLGPAYPFRGGIAQFTALLTNELDKQHSVKIFSFKKQYPKVLFPGKDQLDKSKIKPDYDIDPVLTPYNPFTWFPTYKRIKKWQPDMLILMYWIPFFAPAFGWVVRLLSSFTDVKIVYIIHNIKFHERWPFANLLTRYALGKADVLMTLSKAVNDDAGRFFPAKEIIEGFHPTYDCYDLGRYTRETARKKLGIETRKVILFFGYIKPYKGLDLLLKAFPHIVNKIPDAHLVIVGEVYGDDAMYHDLIAASNLSERITFHQRFVANEEVELYFKAADVLALPYRSATQSGVIQIAYDMGLGAVCTPVGGLPELVLNGETGVVAESVTAEDFAKAVVSYFDLDRQKLSRKIEAEKDKYSWESFARMITE